MLRLEEPSHSRRWAPFVGQGVSPTGDWALSESDCENDGMMAWPGAFLSAALSRRYQRRAAATQAWSHWGPVFHVLLLRPDVIQRYSIFQCKTIQDFFWDVFMSGNICTFTSSLNTDKPTYPSLFPCAFSSWCFWRLPQAPRQASWTAHFCPCWWLQTFKFISERLEKTAKLGHCDSGICSGVAPSEYGQWHFGILVVLRDAGDEPQELAMQKRCLVTCLVEIYSILFLHLARPSQLWVIPSVVDCSQRSGL